MKATIERAQLISALETCTPICGRKHANPTLSRAHLRIGRELWFSATDAVVTVVGARPVIECDGVGDFCISPDLVLEAARKMPDGAIKLALGEDGTLAVTSGKRTFKAVTLSADEYPAAPKRPGGPFVAVPGSALATVLARVRFAMSQEKRPHDGIQIAMGKGEIEAQAFDGRKIAMATVRVDAPGEIRIVLPPELVAALSGVIDTAADVGICSHERSLYIETDAGMFRYVEPAVASFPPKIRQAVEGEIGASFKSPTKPLIDAIKYVEMASGREAPAVKLVAGDGVLRIRALDGQREATDEVPVDGSAPFEIRINPRFTIDALTAAGDECTVTRGENMLRVSGDGFECGIARLIDE